MAETKGKLVTCDRCGAKIFTPCTGEGERDGGFTRWNYFAPLPEGWNKHYEVGQLCPDCNQKYEDIINEFKTGAIVSE